MGINDAAEMLESAKEECSRLERALATAIAERDKALTFTETPSPCKMTQTPPFDFAQCETHDTTFPLGGACKWHGKESISAVLQEESDQQRQRAVLSEIVRDSALEDRDAALVMIAALRKVNTWDDLNGIIAQSPLDALDAYDREVAAGALDEVAALWDTEPKRLVRPAEIASAIRTRAAAYRAVSE